MKTVGDWQLREAESRYNIQWTFAALYDGLLAASTESSGILIITGFVATRTKGLQEGWSFTFPLA
jgi:hypothetical protein